MSIQPMSEVAYHHGSVVDEDSLEYKLPTYTVNHGPWYPEEKLMISQNGEETSQSWEINFSFEAQI